MGGAERGQHVRVFAALGSGLLFGTWHLPRVLIVTLPASLLLAAATAGVLHAYIGFVDGIFAAGTRGLPLEPGGLGFVYLFYPAVLFAGAWWVVGLAKAYFQPRRWLPHLSIGRTELYMVAAQILVSVAATVLVLYFALFVSGAIILILLSTLGGGSPVPPESGGLPIPEGAGPLLLVPAGIVAVWFWWCTVIVQRFAVFTVDVAVRGRFELGEAWSLTRGEGWHLFFLTLLTALATLLIAVPLLLTTALGPPIVQAGARIRSHTAQAIAGLTLPDLDPTALGLLAGVLALVSVIGTCIAYGALMHAYKTLQSRLG